MHPSLNVAVKAARAAGDIISRYSDRIDTLNIEEKAENDYVSEVDKQAEEVIVKHLSRAYPEHGILGEEGNSKEGDGEHLWIIDPLDGTTNFLYGFPQYAVSIGLTINNRHEVGVVYDPLKDELFTASRGNGAHLNNRRLRVSNRPSLKGALLGTGIPFREDQDVDTYMKTMNALLPGSAGIRRAGSAALDLAYVAAGRIDAFWEFGLRPWDMAAGVIIVQEAGGLVGDPNGEPDAMKNGDVLAANPKIFKEMLQKMRPCFKK